MDIAKIILFVSLSAQIFVEVGAEENEVFENFNGFVEIRLGELNQADPNQNDQSIGEARLQLETEKEFDQFTFNFVTDIIYDPVLDEYATDLVTGEGTIDLRQTNIVFSPLDSMDVKLGRQILTWGTGDLLFINDLFAKDWNSFLIGRDDEYLKAPTDAVKFSVFFDAINMDLVYTPKFSADRFIDGKRISFFDRTTNSFRGRDNPLVVNRPDDTFKDDESAVRFYRSFGIYETALYYYNGFWKSPAGQDPVTGNTIFPDLQVFGVSLRGPIAKGIAHVEAGYYKSSAQAASDSLSRNSEYRFLAGYEQELATELTGAIQYYVERKLDYDTYINSLPTSAVQDDEYRRVITLRLAKLLMQQKLKLSFFNFHSPSDKDGYVRLQISYKMSDRFKIETGLNHFYGDQPHTFYSQFENSSNIYFATRYEF